MKKSIIIISCIFVLVGIIVISASLALGANVDTRGTQTITHSISEPFKSISVITGGEDIAIKSSASDKSYAICRENEKLQFSFQVENGELTVKLNDSRKWYDRIGIFFDSADCTIYIPKGEYDSLNLQSESGDIECLNLGISFANASLRTSSGEIDFSFGVREVLTAKTQSGDIEIEGLSANDINTTSSSGEISLDDISSESRISSQTQSGEISLEGCKAESLFLKSSSGKILLKDTSALETIDAKTHSGAISFNRCDSLELCLESSSGSIKGSLLSGKIFDVHSSSGSIKCPSSDRNGGFCTVKTSSGDIKISVIE